MIIVTGPTGSGKTTTLYSLLNYKRSSEVNIVTVEDPIEYQLQGANQVQINPKAGLTFAACLRSILRQDPDTILVGEIRDHETAEIAFHAAMTGHLVLTTLHTNNSVATVLRLLDLGIDPFVLTSSITLVVAQRLVRVTCDACRESYHPSPHVLERLGWDDPKFSFSRGKGCKACHGTGFKGRIGIYEMLRMTPAVREAINARSPEPVIRKAAIQSGMVPLLEAARNKIRQGKTTPEEVMRVIQWVDEGRPSCPQCGKPLSKKTRKCKHCEPKLKPVCTSCGQTLDPAWQVCPHCTSPILPQEQQLPAKVKWGRSQTRQSREATGNTPVRSSLISRDVIAKGARYAPPISHAAAPLSFQLSIHREIFRVGEGRTRRVLWLLHERPLQSLSQASDHQQNGWGLPTAGKVGLDPNPESTRRERPALVEQRASFEAPIGNDDRVIDGDHRVIGKDANFQLRCRGQVAQAGYPQVSRITPLDLQLKLRYDRAHRVGNVLQNFQSLQPLRRSCAPATPRSRRRRGTE